MSGNADAGVLVPLDMTCSRGTSNHLVTGNYKDRARRRARLVERYGWPEIGIVNCFRCEVPLLQDNDPEAPGQSVTCDRIIPGALGGTYADENIRPCCGPCNMELGGYLGALQRQMRKEA